MHGLYGILTGSCSDALVGGFDGLLKKCRSACIPAEPLRDYETIIVLLLYVAGLCRCLFGIQAGWFDGCITRIGFP